MGLLSYSGSICRIQKVVELASFPPANDPMPLWVMEPLGPSAIRDGCCHQQDTYLLGKVGR